MTHKKERNNKKLIELINGKYLGYYEQVFKQNKTFMHLLPHYNALVLYRAKVL
jgi:hypothetical protein